MQWVSWCVRTEGRRANVARACAGDQLLLSSAVPSLHFVVGAAGDAEPALRVLGSESPAHSAVLALVAEIFHEIQVASPRRTGSARRQHKSPIACQARLRRAEASEVSPQTPVDLIERHDTKVHLPGSCSRARTRARVGCAPDCPMPMGRLQASRSSARSPTATPTRIVAGAAASRRSRAIISSCVGCSRRQ
jgi:hypothetical protein